MLYGTISLNFSPFSLEIGPSLPPFGGERRVNQFKLILDPLSTIFFFRGALLFRFSIIPPGNSLVRGLSYSLSPFSRPRLPFLSAIWFPVDPGSILVRQKT